MDGLLVVDKPAGPTSHDVVARMRRVLRERRIGHTGTLDPAATGVLPLVLGRATRLARFLSTGTKSYDAVIRLGRATTTYDAEGEPVGAAYEGLWPSRLAIDRALDAFRGTFMQQPPAFSAKKIQGRRSYRLARAAARDQLFSRPPLRTAAGAPVTVSSIEILSIDASDIALRIDCGAGFYVRSLAHDLGNALGTGAHLAALRRTRSGDVTVADAAPLDALERDPSAAARRVIGLERLLPELPSVVLTAAGVRSAANGRDLGAADAAAGFEARDSGFVRLFSPAGALVGIAAPASGRRPSELLHPFVVLM